MVDAVYKGNKTKIEIYDLYYDDIKSFWDFFLNNPNFQPDFKQVIRKSYSLDIDLEIFGKLKGYSLEQKQEILTKAIQMNEDHEKSKEFLENLLYQDAFVAKAILACNHELDKIKSV